MKTLLTKSLCQPCAKSFHMPIYKVNVWPILSRPLALRTCSRTHFHSCGCPLSLLPNQVNLLILSSHVFFCYIINPSWTGCREQQRLWVALGACKERPSASDYLNTLWHLRNYKRARVVLTLTGFCVHWLCTRGEGTLPAISFSWLSKPQWQVIIEISISYNSSLFRNPGTSETWQGVPHIKITSSCTYLVPDSFAEHPLYQNRADIPLLSGLCGDKCTDRP